MRRSSAPWIMIIGVPLLVIGGLVGLAVAPRVRSFLHTSDQLHYAVHLAAGRIFSMCRWTDDLAQDHYIRGLYHARTERRVRLLTTAQPESVRARVQELPELAAGGLRFMVARGPWGGRTLPDRAR